MDLVKTIAETLGFGPNAGAGRAIPLGTHRRAADHEHHPRGDVERSANVQTYPCHFDVHHWFLFLNRFYRREDETSVDCFSRYADRSRVCVNRCLQRTYPVRGYQRSFHSIVDRVLSRS